MDTGGGNIGTKGEGSIGTSEEGNEGIMRLSGGKMREEISIGSGW